MGGANAQDTVWHLFGRSRVLVGTLWAAALLASACGSSGGEAEFGARALGGEVHESQDTDGPSEEESGVEEPGILRDESTPAVAFAETLTGEVPLERPAVRAIDLQAGEALRLYAVSGPEPSASSKGMSLAIGVDPAQFQEWSLYLSQFTETTLDEWEYDTGGFLTSDYYMENSDNASQFAAAVLTHTRFEPPPVVDLGWDPVNFYAASARGLGPGTGAWLQFVAPATATYQILVGGEGEFSLTFETRLPPELSVVVPSENTFDEGPGADNPFILAEDAAAFYGVVKHHLDFLFDESFYDDDFVSTRNDHPYGPTPQVRAFIDVYLQHRLSPSEARVSSSNFDLNSEISDDLEAFWESLVTDLIGEVSVSTVLGSSLEVCRRPNEVYEFVSGGGAAYCGDRGNLISIRMDEGSAIAGTDAFGSEVAVRSYMLAHAFGHHVQRSLDLDTSLEDATADVLKAAADELRLEYELQADCAAGLWAADAASRGIVDLVAIEAVVQGLEAVTSKTSGLQDAYGHGSAQQRLDAFLVGTVATSLADC